MKEIEKSPLFTELTSEEETSVSGGVAPWLIAGAIAGAAWARDHVTGVFTDIGRKYYFGDYNSKAPERQYPGLKWALSIDHETVLKGYGQTPGWLMSLFKR
jgi:lactobin A/cerein 7B family class IIb bacteriocin